LDVVQRLYSMFPAGGPGIGLALLRLILAGMLVAGALSSPSRGPADWLAAAFGGFLFAGVFTPIVAVLAGLLCVYQVVLSNSHILLAGIRLGLALAVALLGPGAYSVDAARYGRRLISGPHPRRDQLP